MMDDLRDRIASVLARHLFSGGDYEDVPVDEMFTRPRYMHLKMRIDLATNDVLNVMDSRMATADKEIKDGARPKEGRFRLDGG